MTTTGTQFDEREVEIANLKHECDRLRTYIEFYVNSRSTCFLDAQKKIHFLKGEVERLQFVNKEERETIDSLSRLIAEALAHTNQYHSWFTATSTGVKWVEEAREAVR